MENLLSDKPLPTGQVLENVGYGEISQEPQRITESIGFQRALAEIGLREALVAQGVNPKKIAEKIDVLLEAKRGKNPDYLAIDKGLKHATAIYGILPEQQKTAGNTYNFIFSETVQEKVKLMNEEIKSMLIHNETPSENKEN